MEGSEFFSSHSWVWLHLGSFADSLFKIMSTRELIGRCRLDIGTLPDEREFLKCSQTYWENARLMSCW